MENTDTENYKVKGNFFSRLLDLLLGKIFKGKRNKRLNALYHQLNKSGYKFYNYKKSLVLPPFPEFLYSVYETIAPIREYFLKNTEDNYYKNQILNYTMSEKQQDMLSQILPENIRTMVKTIQLKTIAEKGRDCYTVFRKEYTNDNMMKINSLYNSLLVLKQFCLLDYYASLRKFSSEIKENSFGLMPKFAALPKSYVDEFILDFLNATSLMLNIYDWKPLMAFLKTFPDFKSVNLDSFYRVVEDLHSLEEKKVISPLAKLIKADADYEITVTSNPKDIVIPFAEQIYQEFRATVEDLIKEKQLQMQKKLLDDTFEGNSLKKLKFYTKEESDKLRSLGVVTYDACNSLCFLNTFLELYLNTEINTFVDVFEVQATSSKSNYVSSFSRVFTTLKEHKDELVSFDQTLDAKFSTGYKLAQMLARVQETDEEEKEKNRVKVNLELDAVNAMASSILVNSMKDIDNFVTYFDELSSDRNKNTLIVNWGEIDSKVRGGSIGPLMERISRHLKAFQKLMQNARKLE